MAYDNDPILSSSYNYNFPSTRLIREDIAQLTGAALRTAAGGRIDGIFGGPPCQGFSDIGRRRADDPRRLLLGHFYRLIGEVRPKFFIMENVRGLAYSNARDVLDEALNYVRNSYSIFGPHILDAARFGAATRRSRLFVIGVRNDLDEPLTLEDVLKFERTAATVEAAIADLEGSTSLGEVDLFDVWRISRRGRPSEYARQLRSRDGRFTGQKTTIHTPTVIERFAAIPEGGVDSVGRHPRLAWTGQCPALRAGTGNDKGSYQAVRPIHPSKSRVITVREAARLQGFPDAFRFHPTIWHSFRMIGNSVSPIIASAIFSAIWEKLGRTDAGYKSRFARD